MGALDSLQDIVERHPVVSHPILKLFREGTLTRDQVKSWFEQQLYFSISLPDCFASLFARTPIQHWKVKRPLVDLLQVEAWGTNDVTAHSNYFKELATFLEIDIETLTKKAPKPYTKVYISERSRICLQEPIEIGLAAIALGNERLNLCIYDTYRAGIHKIRGLELCPTGYFDAHVRDEHNDFLVFNSLYDALVQTDAQITQVAQGLQHILDERNIFFDMLYIDLFYEYYSQQLGMIETPLHDMSSISSRKDVKIFAKDESKNSTGSIKGRAALYNLIKAMLHSSNERLHIVDASSGNYAKALAYIAHRFGHTTTLFIPEAVADEVKDFVRYEGINATIISENISNSDVARIRARKYTESNNNVIYLDQYNNPGTADCHYFYTADEIMRQLSSRGVKPTHFIAGIGTGGTVIGIGRRLKEEYGTRILGVQAKEAHTIRGIRSLEDTHLPTVYSENKSIVDEVLTVDINDIRGFRERSAGLCYGASSMAHLYCAERISRELKNAIVVTVLPDKES